MKTANAASLNDGLYRLFWKAGGYSLGVVGRLHNGDRWFSCSNWTSHPNTVQSLVSRDWNLVERVELVRTTSSQRMVDECRLSIKQPIDPAIAEIVRDLFLAGHDVDAIAVLSSELNMVQSMEGVLVNGNSGLTMTAERGVIAQINNTNRDPALIRLVVMLMSKPGWPGG